MSSSRSWTPVAPPGGAGPVGAYSPAAIAGELVFTAGQVPQNPETGEFEGDRPFAEQTRRTLTNLERVLEAAGSGLADVVQVTVYLADHADWAEFNEVYQEFFSAPFPARAVVGAELTSFRVEMTAIEVRRESGA